MAFNWSLKEQLIYTKREDNLFCIDPLNNGESETYNLNFSPRYFYRLIDNSLIIVDNLNRPLAIYTGNELLPFNMEEIGNIVIGNQDPRYLTLYKGMMEDKVVKVYDWAEKKVRLEMKAGTGYKVLKNKVFISHDWTLKCYDLDGVLNWRNDLVSPDELKMVWQKGIIGMYDRDLWVKLTDDRFVVINVDSGATVLGPIAMKDIVGLPVSAGQLHIDEKRGRLKVLGYSYYIEIDLVTYQPVIVRKHDDDWVIRFGQFFEDSRVCFIGNNRGFNQRSIAELSVGIFNTNTFQVEWCYTFPDEDKYYFLMSGPQANEKYVSVRDTNDTLHLFER